MREGECFAGRGTENVQTLRFSLRPRASMQPTQTSDLKSGAAFPVVTCRRVALRPKCGSVGLRRDHLAVRAGLHKLSEIRLLVTASHSVPRSSIKGKFQSQQSWTFRKVVQYAYA